MDDRALAAASFMVGAFADILSPAATLSMDGIDLHGRDDCARYLAGLFADLEPDSIDLESVNGEPGLALRRNGHVVGVTVLRMRDRHIDHIWLVCSPDKLRSWN